MPADYLHGVETIEMGGCPKAIKAVKTSVIGVIGTAPFDEVTEENQTVNKPVLLTRRFDCYQYFGNRRDGYTLPDALDAIYSQGSGLVIAINVFDPSKHESVEDVTVYDVVGGVDPVTGKRTGLSAFEDCYSLFGFYPKIIIAPTFCEDLSVANEMQTLCEKIRAIGLIDAPIGTTVQDAIEGRGPEGNINFNFYSDRMVLCYPHVQAHDAMWNQIVYQPYSQYLAGVIAAKDMEKGYHWSPSNTEIKCILGTERQLTSMFNDADSEVNLLNEAGIVTIYNSYGTGYRTWGNRNSLFPANGGDPITFINIRRTADILHESVEYAMLQYIDSPIDDALIDAIKESVNAFIRTLIGRGALVDGKCTFHPDKNDVYQMADGHLIFDIEFMPPPPAERITFESYVNRDLLQGLGSS